MSVVFLGRRNNAFHRSLSDFVVTSSAFVVRIGKVALSTLEQPRRID